MYGKYIYNKIFIYIFILHKKMIDFIISGEIEYKPKFILMNKFIGFHYPFATEACISVFFYFIRNFGFIPE